MTLEWPLWVLAGLVLLVVLDRLMLWLEARVPCGLGRRDALAMKASGRRPWRSPVGEPA